MGWFIFPEKLVDTFSEAENCFIRRMNNRTARLARGTENAKEKILESRGKSCFPKTLPLPVGRKSLLGELGALSETGGWILKVSTVSEPSRLNRRNTTMQHQRKRSFRLVRAIAYTSRSLRPGLFE
jgi:hypothetical protein